MRPNHLQLSSVSRPETYHIKLMIRKSLVQCTDELNSLVPSSQEDDIESSESSFSSSISDHIRLPVSSSRNEPKASQSQTTRISELGEKLRGLLRLYDDVLVEEYSPDHASLLHLQDKDQNITCDFCTCDVFQSFFECQNCVDRSELEEAHEIAPGHGLIICPSCYVDGRVCECGRMTPTQYHRFEELLSDRDRAVQVLRRCPQRWSHYDFLKDNYLQRLVRFISQPLINELIL